ncbi:MAG: periplasmic heavy metal sensor [Gammaproteobacteria bacterium]|nr:periplasmic heavy metal sensor [Gammaproteobacteria bacterium]MCZ6855247.1 periplasmic heavy metal sensor [Gammaproteobacteria bacterium]
MTHNKWLIVALVVSLAINFALAGFFIGRASNLDLHRTLMDPTLGFSRVLRQLPDERRAELRPLIRRHFRGMRPSLGGIRQAQSELNEALTADPFDAQRLAVALEQFREHLADNQMASHDSLVALVAALEPGERRLLVESMRRGMFDRRDRRQAPSRRPPPSGSPRP